MSSMAQMPPQNNRIQGPIRFQGCSRPSRILRTGMTPLAVGRALLGVDRIALLVYECITTWSPVMERKYGT